jgi:histidyl-tRNA synthetase
VFELITYCEKKSDSLKEDAPKSITFLSEPSRIHFKEVLEFLEKLNIPYKINHHLVGNRKYCSETIFEIVSHADGKKHPECQTLALGVRYDGLAKKINLKKEVSGVGISLLCKRPAKETVVTKIKKPIVYFVQLGFEAKLYSLHVIEILRQENIMVHQALSKDKLVGQLSGAERLNMPYMILIGKKEAMEESAIVRDMDTRSQETIPLSQLAQYLKKLGA